MNSGLEMVETKHVSGANVSRAEEKTLLNSFIVQACQKVIKVGGAIALEPAKSWGGGYSPPSPPSSGSPVLKSLCKTCHYRRRAINGRSRLQAALE